MKRPFTLNLGANEAAMISHSDGVFVIERMQLFVNLDDARRDALARLNRRLAA